MNDLRQKIMHAVSSLFYIYDVKIQNRTDGRR